MNFFFSSFFFFKECKFFISKEGKKNVKYKSHPEIWLMLSTSNTFQKYSISFLNINVTNVINFIPF